MELAARSAIDRRSRLNRGPQATLTFNQTVDTLCPRNLMNAKSQAD
jgi:hypothetical protein